MLALLKSQWHKILGIAIAYIVTITAMFGWASIITKIVIGYQILLAMAILYLPNIVLWAADKLKPKPKPKKGQKAPAFDLQADIRKFTESHKN